MLLIEALNINSGGPAELLYYLLEELESRQIEYYILLDFRLPTRRIPNLNRCSVYKRGFINRSKILKKHLNEQKNIKTLFCFGNYPPPFLIKENIKVVTFFHNMLLLEVKNTPKLITKLAWTVKTLYFKKILGNSNFFIFQSKIVENSFKIKFKVPVNVNLETCLFFNLPYLSKLLNKFQNQQIKRIPQSFIYPSLAYPHKNHNRLLDAWNKLYDSGLTPILYLTVPIKNVSLLEKIDFLKRKGVKINNLGVISYEAVQEQTYKCEFCIFPSLLETVGLGLIETTFLGCKILAGDLTYSRNLIKPSLVFDPLDIEDMIRAIKIALTNKNLMPATLCAQNEIEKLLAILNC